MAKRLTVLAAVFAAMLSLAVPALAQEEISVTGVLEEQGTKTDGATVYALVDEATDEGYYVETATGEDLGGLVGQRVIAYGTVRNDSGRVLTANRIEFPDAPQPAQPAAGDEFSGFGVIERTEGGYGLYTGGGPGSGIYLEGDFAAFEGQDVYVSGTITNETPVTLSVVVVEPAAVVEGEEISVTGVVEEEGAKADGTVFYGLVDEATGQGYALEGDFDFATFEGQNVAATGIYEAGGGMAVLRVSGIEPTSVAATTPGGGTTMGESTMSESTMSESTVGETTGAAEEQYEDGGTPEQAGIDLNEDGAVDDADAEFAVQTSEEGVAATLEEGALPGTGGLILPVVGIVGALLLVGGLLYYRKLAS